MRKDCPYMLVVSKMRPGNQNKDKIIFAISHGCFTKNVLSIKI